ncbi:GNAT family N-acetyltransferase [Chitinophaga pendula]|uniref:GNAT family N-acetyltransferase n=1 Tax=Chitinophaga TaxID=79328 RepID=UPI000BAF361C|nr:MULTISPECIES: GNAT family N-acetyltransferase [Chitinophaga]ASZ09832.1 GNAT family N-acetyltransferase [Chitinophaga sp. MD30]UCJ07226.1 GNAT family N-acetyltransferase [Chitinophaga pendula]
MNWIVKPFDTLTGTEVYNILHLRNEVFVLEQQCPYLDTDYSDQKALHLMGLNDQGLLVAYARLFAPGIKYEEASIGRVVTAPAARGTGAGKLLIEKALQELEAHYGKGPVKIGAQQYLTRFYNGFGFEQTSEMYLEDNIPHIEMRLS